MTDIFASKAAFSAWRVNPAQDRCPIKVTSYTLSSDELAKYDNIQPYKRLLVLSNMTEMVTRRDARKIEGR